MNKPRKVYDKLFLFLNCYNSRIIQEYSQASKFGRNKDIQPGPKKQHSKILKKSVLPSNNLVVTAILSGFCPDPETNSGYWRQLSF